MAIIVFNLMFFSHNSAMTSSRLFWELSKNARFSFRQAIVVCWDKDTERYEAQSCDALWLAM